MATTTEEMTDSAQSSVAESCEDCHVEEVLDQLDRDLVGLKPVKTRIREIAALLMVDKLRKGMGLISGAPSLHMSFTGNPGTGKTTVALRMAEILHRLGYIRRPEVITVTRDDLVGQYIGHTAPKTKAVLKRAMGGVLFIDEAYYLYRPENERDYGQESIEILLQVMENNRDDLVVILAGYKDRMDTFFSSNPGMSSRVAHHLDFPDFAVDELAQITQLMLQQQQYRFSPEAEQAFYEYIQKRTKMPQFANARSIRNALDRARLRQANRLYAKGGTLTREQLMTIEAEDVLASRVFQEGKPDGLPNQIKEEPKAEEKTLESVRQIDHPVVRAPASEPQHAIKDKPIMQTDMTVNESARPNSASANAGFGGMQHTLPLTQPASRWQKRSKRASAARVAQPAPRHEAWREPPKVVNGRCEFGQCEAPPKVEETATTGGQIVTGISVERSIKVTGNDAGSCKKITGTEYIGPDQYKALCASDPYIPPAKVGVTRTAKNKAVTGTQVGTSSKVTGDEAGSCKHITGNEYLNPAAADVPCAAAQSPGPAKVNVSRTTHGRTVTGTLVGGSTKLTGDEYGACHGITGTEYIGAELQQELCGTKPLASPAKVGVSRTWQDQSVSGSQVGRSEKVTGDEYGACKGVTGTPYVGRDRYEAFCDPRDVAANAARLVVERRPAGHAMTGIQPSVKGKMTGDERGACLNVSGTPYVGDDQYAQVCAGAGSQGVKAKADKSGTFSVASPTHATRAVTGTAYEGATRITGPLAKALGVMTGTAEFRHPAYRETLVAPEGQKTEAKSRVTGEGTEARHITGDDWARNERVTGTEGASTRRNPTLRGGQRGVVMSAKQNKERERPEIPVSKITGSSGNAATGSAITYSGGARG